MIPVFDRFENVVEKLENAGYQVRVNSLPKDKILDLKALADNKINVTEKLQFVFGRVGQHEKRRKCWLWHLSKTMPL